MTFEMPSPTSPQPIIPAVGIPMKSATASPIAATALDARRTRPDPNWTTRRSPPKRPAAMASENAAKPTAATAGLLPSVSWR